MATTSSVTNPTSITTSSGSAVINKLQSGLKVFCNRFDLSCPSTATDNPIVFDTFMMSITTVVLGLIFYIVLYRDVFVMNLLKKFIIFSLSFWFITSYQYRFNRIIYFFAILGIIYFIFMDSLTI